MGGYRRLKAVKKIREAGLLVRRVVTIVDRQEGGDLAMKNAGLQLISLFLLLIGSIGLWRLYWLREEMPGISSVRKKRFR